MFEVAAHRRDALWQVERAGKQEGPLLMQQSQWLCEESSESPLLQMTAEGNSTKKIAEILKISPRTVEFHRYRAMEALGLHTIAELVQYAFKHRLVSP